MDDWPNRIVYEVVEIPDPADTTYLGIAGGDVKGRIASAFELLMRTLVCMPPKSSQLGIIYRYNPAFESKDPQSRLSIYIQLSAEDQSILQSLECLIIGGMIGRFYQLAVKEGKFLDLSDFNWTCYIERRQDFIKPLYTNDFNPYIPECYFTVTSFEPNPDNDYLLLDRTLDRIQEPVVIVLAISPSDISELLNAHTAYLAQLNSVNRSWQNEDSDLDVLEDAEWSNSQKVNFAGKLKTLNYKDPLADDILRRQRRFHETLLEPHLHFEFKVMTQTEAVSRLVASTVCSSALADGKYQLKIEKTENDNRTRKI